MKQQKKKKKCQSRHQSHETFCLFRPRKKLWYCIRFIKKTEVETESRKSKKQTGNYIQNWMRICENLKQLNFCFSEHIFYIVGFLAAFTSKLFPSCTVIPSTTFSVRTLPQPSNLNWLRKKWENIQSDKWSKSIVLSFFLYFFADSSRFNFSDGSASCLVRSER